MIVFLAGRVPPRALLAPAVQGHLPQAVPAALADDDPPSLEQIGGDADAAERPAPEGELEEYVISVDYGTANPCSFGLWGRREGVWYRVDEYYYASRTTGVQLTDQEYVSALGRLAGGHRVRCVVADPSAASFITALRQAGYRVVKANNDVLCASLAGSKKS